MPLPQKTVQLKAKVSTFWIGSQRTASKTERELQQEPKTQKVIFQFYDCVNITCPGIKSSCYHLISYIIKL